MVETRQPPKYIGDLPTWARQMEEFLSEYSEVRSEVRPQTPLLAHQMANTTYSAATDGVLMYNPAEHSPVVSIGGLWRRLFFYADFASRSDFIDWTLSLPFEPPEGAIVHVAPYGTTYYYQSGATAIPDALGWLPFGNVMPDHFGENVSPAVTDMTAATQAAVDYLGSLFPGPFSSGGEIWFAPTRYLLNDVTIVHDGISFRGTGRNSSAIINNTRDKSTFIFKGTDLYNTDAPNRCHVKDLEFFNTSSDPIAGAHVTCVRAQVVVQGCFLANHFRGVEFFGTNESCRVLDTDITQGGNTTALNGRSCAVAIMRAQVDPSDPNGFEDSTDPGNFFAEPNSVYINNCNFRSNAFGMECCIRVGCVDGLYCTNNHFGFATDAIVWLTPEQPTIGFNNLQFNNVFFDPMPGTTSYGVRLFDYYSVNCQNVGSVLVTDSIIGGPDLDGVDVVHQVDRLTINGCSIKNCGRRAITINDADAREIIITDNHIYNTNSATLSAPAIQLFNGSYITISNNIFRTAFRGIQVSANPTNVTIGPNQYVNMTNNYSVYLSAPQQASNRVIPHNVEESSTVASAATILLPAGHELFNITGTTNISTIRAVTPTSSYEGRVVTLVFNGVLTLVNGSGNLRLNGSANFVTAAGSTITLKYTGTTWYETGRSA